MVFTTLVGRLANMKNKVQVKVPFIFLYGICVGNDF